MSSNATTNMGFPTRKVFKNIFWMVFLGLNKMLPILKKNQKEGVVLGQANVKQSSKHKDYHFILYNK